MKFQWKLLKSLHFYNHVTLKVSLVRKNEFYIFSLKYFPLLIGVDVSPVESENNSKLRATFNMLHPLDEGLTT